MSGTMSGPGAIARPDRRADQPQASCSQSTMERSIAPNEAEKKMATNDAPVKWRERNKDGMHERRCGSIMQWRTKRPMRTAPPSSVPTMLADPQPQSAALHQPEGEARHAGRDEHHAERVGPLDWTGPGRGAVGATRRPGRRYRPAR